MTDTAGPAKKMRLRYQGQCRLCGTEVEAGAQAVYFRDAKAIECLSCFDDAAAAEPPTAPPPADTPGAPTAPEPLAYSEGVAGDSARDEYERRMARREARVRERFPRAGGLLLKIYEEGQPTKAWKVGAGGEETLGGTFNRIAGPELRVLHDRRVPRTRANIDHIVVCRNGVMVIDAKRYKGRPSLKVEGGFFRPTVHKLTVDGRDRTKLVEGVRKQVDLVTAALEDVPVPVQGFLCFLDADWPLIGGAFTIHGVGVLWPRRLRKLLEKEGPLGSEEIEQIQARLAAAFPAA
ncbi:nuclease-related domain-containing protein [Tessaracoccus oleiagri]|uniref:Nuclease-related domain-containing protein n=1 Tax=Tessaracoccus oleiagri TaxID=686624 RepID=A0A1G9I9C5_9ACTN|nr:nuclease-related domain-containing protein [Tessaracoccus oleiagri]SDL21434.1 Nuclease-related domain-containing protein [Tessaracoccus oleiagri]